MGTLDRIVHRDDPPQAHGRDLGVREHVSDETGQLGVGLDELAAGRLLADVLAGASSVALPQDPLEDSNLRRDAVCRYEPGRKQDARGEHADGRALRLEVGDPGLTTHAVGGHRKRDDSVPLSPWRHRFGDYAIVLHQNLPLFRR